MIKHKKKAFVFDIDGTIIHNNQPLNSEITELFDEICMSGHALIFASSRSIRGIKHIIPKKYWNVPIIYCNGAFASINQNVTYKNPIDSPIVQQLTNCLNKMESHYYLELGENYHYPQKMSHNFFDILKNESHGEEYIDSIDKAITRAVYKIAYLDPATSELINLVNQYVNEIKIYIHEDGTADIVSRSCSKWEALEHMFCRSLYKMYVFGNDQNDLEMLANADYSVAISPECGNVRKVSNIIIKDKNAKSLVEVVKKLLCL